MTNLLSSCQITLQSHTDVTAEGIKKLIEAFEPMGVTKTQIEKFCQCRAEAIKPAQIVRLRSIYTSLRDGMSSPSDWFEPDETQAPAAIEVEAALSDDLETVAVTSRTAFALSGVEGFKVAYALLADGMTGTGRSWQQANNYRGYSSALDIDAWDQFFNGGSYVTVEFNDVVILAPDSKGVTGSVPAEITVGEWNEHEYTFTLSDATSAYTASTVSLVQAPWKLRVVAMLLNADGEIVNAAKCNVSTPAGVNGVESSMDEPVEVARYSLDGRLLSEPERGVNIVKMSDGTVRKVIVK